MLYGLADIDMRVTEHYPHNVVNTLICYYHCIIMFDDVDIIHPLLSISLVIQVTFFLFMITNFSFNYMR